MNPSLRHNHFYKILILHVLVQYTVGCNFGKWFPVTKLSHKEGMIKFYEPHTKWHVFSSILTYYIAIPNLHGRNIVSVVCTYYIVMCKYIIQTRLIAMRSNAKCLEVQNVVTIATQHWTVMSKQVPHHYAGYSTWFCNTIFYLWYFGDKRIQCFR